MTNTIFVDTTIQVDRIIKGHDAAKRAAIESLLGEYDFKAACTYSLVEYKRVVLQNLSLCLEYLNEEGSYFLALERAARLGVHRPRRLATLVSIMSWVGYSSGDLEVEVGGKHDETLTLQSISFIRTNIFFLWKRFEKICRYAPGCDELRPGKRVAQEGQQGQRHPSDT